MPPRSISNVIKNHESGEALYSSDVISAVAITETEQGKYNWIFVVEHFDYALTADGDDFMRVWVIGKIDKS
ncbi:hypothetical protein QNH14_00695 [Apirhabdus apintestini]|nr:hypothetical protein QNH14_00695 [Enterobacteriaceae bacterium CA-0114]